jgi:hypothetical protein
MRPARVRAGSKVPNGYCPNHATGVTFPDVEVAPLQYVD